VRPINLLPARYRPARASGERPGIAYAAIGILAVLLIMVVAYVLTNKQINDAKKKTADAQAQEAASQARIGQLQAYGDFANLKDQRESAVRSVAESRFDYERLMREMALVLPHNTYLTAFSATAGGASSTAATGTTTPTSSGPAVSITACAPSHQAVATAVVRLRQLHNIQDVDLKSSQKGSAPSGTTSSSSSTTTNGCAVTWTADLTFNAETGTTPNQPVPARLGGGQ
jgi:Tfp pilus assembly protein PilN